jgi:UPF0755 protein
LILPDDDYRPGRLADGGLPAAGRAARREAAMARAKVRRRRWRGLLLLVVLLGTAGIVVGKLTSLPIPGLNDSVAAGLPARVSIPQGASTRQIGRLLADAGVVERASAFEGAALQRGVADRLRPGDYLLETRMDENQLFEVLVAGPGATADRITFPEGLTVRQITQRMAKGGRWTTAEIQAALADPSLTSAYRPKGKPLEGLLFPATYDIQPESKPVDLLQAMLDELDQVMQGQDLEAAKRLHLTEYDILTVASMVEREARVEQDRAKVARVIYNRLKKKMALQIDATIQYTFKEPKPRLSAADLRINSPYNSYTRKGLPPTPIAAPGTAAIEAALAPADGPWLYYVVTSKDGTHTFTDSYQKFLELKEKAQRAGLA